MIKLDNDLLQELGLGELSDDEKNDALDKINETLEERAGDRIIDQMDRAQMDEFEQHVKQGGAEKTMDWLKSSFPGYQQLVEEELEKIKNEVKAGGLVALNSAENQAS